MNKITLDPKEIKNLAPMPATVIRLASMIADPDASLDAIADIIEYDQAITTNVLRLSNSLLGKAVAQIHTVKDAVVRLGGPQVIKLVVGKQVYGPLKTECPGYELGEHELWRHSVAAALATEHMAQFLSQKIPNFAFIAALIHDIGKLLLGRQIERKHLEEIRNMVLKEKVAYVQAEKEVLGTDHAEAGGAIARFWELPDPLVDAIELHHKDQDLNPDLLMDIVHIANTTARVIGEGLGSEQMFMKVSEGAPGRLGLTPRDLELICACVKDSLAETDRLFSGGDHGT